MVVPAEPPILEPLVTDIRGRLGEDLVGLYLYGSAVTGGFDPGVSDVDLMAVTAREVENLDMAGLEAMHRDLLRHHPDWKDRRSEERRVGERSRDQWGLTAKKK